MPELPTSAELAPESDENGEEPEMTVPVNKIKGAWESRSEYLRAHYGLLREDAVNGLREAVQQVSEEPSMGEDRSIHIYEKVCHPAAFVTQVSTDPGNKVHLLGFVFSPQGLATRVAFSTKRAGKRILWEQSKRLISGSVVVLSPKFDMFKRIRKVAVVAARPLDGVMLNPPELDLYFSTHEELEIDPSQEWIMLESGDAYFEAHRYTLTALQRITNEKSALPSHTLDIR